MSHFKAKMHQIRFLASVRTSVRLLESVTNQLLHAVGMHTVGFIMCGSYKIAFFYTVVHCAITTSGSCPPC